MYNEPELLGAINAPTSPVKEGPEMPSTLFGTDAESVGGTMSYSGKAGDDDAAVGRKGYVDGDVAG